MNCNCSSFFLNIEIIDLKSHGVVMIFRKYTNQSFQKLLCTNWLQTMDSSNEWCLNNWITSDISGRETVSMFVYTYLRAADKWFTPPLYLFVGDYDCFIDFTVDAHWWLFIISEQSLVDSSGFDFSFCFWHMIHLYVFLIVS